MAGARVGRWGAGNPHPRPLSRPAGEGGCRSCENSATWPANTNDIRLRCRPAPPHFHLLTRPDKALGHSCGGRKLAALVLHVMLSGAGGGVETSLRGRWHTTGRLPRDSSAPLRLARNDDGLHPSYQGCQPAWFLAFLMPVLRVNRPSHLALLRSLIGRFSWPWPASRLLKHQESQECHRFNVCAPEP